MASELIDETEFHYFRKALRIDSKERGLCSLGDNMLSSQIMWMDQIQEGMKGGVREFVTLKARQMGLSTVSLAADMYWVYKHQAINAAIVTQDEAARDGFRTTLALYRAGLDDEWQQEVIDDNRNQLVFRNGSRIRFLVAGTRSKTTGSSKVGRSGALVVMHGTECAYWGDSSTIDALRASFAQHNPIRFYHWESTANGENWFKDLWDDAQKAKSIKPIFISWWANDYYGITKDDPIYAHYWLARPKLSREEALITREVSKRYGMDINDQQWAWYRYQAAEKITDEMQLTQEFPHLPELAFVATGSAFFRAESLNRARIKVRSLQRRAEHYRIECGMSFEETVVKKVSEKSANLVVWDEPENDGWYVIGVDPSFSASPTSNNSVVSVWRAWYNRLEQVAEYVDNSVSMHALAWVFAYLAGHYGRTLVNIEVTGPGTATLQEFDNLRRAAFSGRKIAGPAAMKDVVLAIRQYLYKRVDSSGAPSNFRHTKTTYDIKEQMMNGLKDFMEREVVQVSSEALLSEMQSVRREPGEAPEAPSNRRDDRVTAAALATLAWNDQLRGQLLAQGVFYEPPKLVQIPSDPIAGHVNLNVAKFLARIGILPEGSPPPPKRTVVMGQKRTRANLDRAENGRSTRGY
jgi:hypothetical protein